MSTTLDPQIIPWPTPSATQDAISLSRYQPQLLHELQIVEEVLLFGYPIAFHADKRGAFDLDGLAGCGDPEEFAGMGAFEDPMLGDLVALAEAILDGELDVGKTGHVVGIEVLDRLQADHVLRAGMNHDIRREVRVVEQLQLPLVDDFIPDINILLDFGINGGFGFLRESRKRREALGRWLSEAEVS